MSDFTIRNGQLALDKIAAFMPCVTEGPYRRQEADNKTLVVNEQGETILEVPWEREFTHKYRASNAHRDASYFACCDPARMRSIIACNAALQEKLTSLEKQVEAQRKCLDICADTIATLSGTGDA